MSVTDERGELAEFVERLRAERDRAIETRENANAVSIRLEGELRRVIAERDWAREALAMIASPAPWVKLEDVREYARARLTEGQQA